MTQGMTFKCDKIMGSEQATPVCLGDEMDILPKHEQLTLYLTVNVLAKSRG